MEISESFPRTATLKVRETYVMNQSENRARIQEFFFGRMTEDERIEFEKSFAANFALLEEMRAFEDDLIEKYVRGWMNPDEKTAFESHFLNSEARRGKVEFTRNLIDEMKAAESWSKTSIWAEIAAFLTFPRIAIASAFAVIALIFGSWFMLRIPLPEDDSVAVVNRPENPEVRKDNENGNVPPNPNVPSNESLNKPPVTETPTLTPEPRKIPQPTIVPNPVLALAAGTLRDGGAINELKIPKNARGATFRLNLKSADYTTFNAIVTDGEGQVVFRSGNLRVSNKTVTLVVPAENLKRGDYRIRLSGRNPQGEDEPAADFQFRVN